MTSVFEVEVYKPKFLRLLKRYKSKMGDPDALKVYVEKKKKLRKDIINVNLLIYFSTIKLLTFSLFLCFSIAKGSDLGFKKEPK